MCCLFGIIDYKQGLNQKQLNKIIAVLSKACEVRGTDATGIAYNTADKLCIYKRPLPAHKMHYKIPDGVHTVMGHTRMTTQGNERFNFNNHPFYGRTDNTEFALAHNGVLHNDLFSRRREKLPETKIETDSYIAVQLIEQKRTLCADSLKYMAERLEGSFTITVLDRDDNLYFVKGDNPMCIYHFKEKGLYIYASTEDILITALKKMPCRFGKAERIKLSNGEILKTDRLGRITVTAFDDSNLYSFGYPYSFGFVSEKHKKESEYIKSLKYVAEGFGYSGDYIDYLLEEGFSTDDIEEIIYCS